MSRQITKNNIYNYLDGNGKMILNKLGLSQPHIKEQVIHRLHEVAVKSPECLNENCIVCGCETRSKVWEDRGCTGGCYPAMKDAEAWQQYKETNNIEIDEV